MDTRSRRIDRIAAEQLLAGDPAPHRALARLIADVTAPVDRDDLAGEDVAAAIWRTASPHGEPRAARRVRPPAAHVVPVFVDRSGARRRLAMLTGISLAGVLVLGLGLMVAGVFGSSPLTLPGLPSHRTTPAVVIGNSAKPTTSASTGVCRRLRPPRTRAPHRAHRPRGQRRRPRRQRRRVWAIPIGTLQPTLPNRTHRRAGSVAVHVKRREPRAHWVLLILAMLVLLGELCINGYVRHIGAEGSGPTPQGLEVGTGRSHRRGGRCCASTADGVHQPVDAGPDDRADLRRRPGPAVHAADPRGAGPVPRPRHVLRDRVAGEPVPRPVPAGIVAGGNEIGSHTFTHVEPASRAGLAAAARADAGRRTRSRGRPVRARYADAAAVLVRRRPRSPAPTTPRCGPCHAAGYLVVVADHDTDDWRRPGVAAHRARRDTRVRLPGRW